MASLARISRIQQRWADRATFLTIYIQEAHAAEKEEFKNPLFKIETHQSLGERLEAAGELLRAEELPGPLLVDNMRDEASTAYGALPERLYILLDRKIVYQGGLGPHGYNPEEVNSWLEKYFS